MIHEGMPAWNHLASTQSGSSSIRAFFDVVSKTFNGFWTTSACIGRQNVYNLCSNDYKKKETYITGNALLSLGGAVNCCLAARYHLSHRLSHRCQRDPHDASLFTPISIGSGFTLAGPGAM